MKNRFQLSVMLLISSGLAQAATTSTTFQVSATVLASCSVSATDLAFGDYDPLSGTPLDATSTVTVNCTTGTPYKIQLSAGIGSGATTTVRKMTNGADTLNYGLYQESSHTTNWGDTTDTDTVNATASTAPADHIVYGRIPINQNVPANTYTDTVTVTVNY